MVLMVLFLIMVQVYRIFASRFREAALFEEVGLWCTHLRTKSICFKIHHFLRDLLTVSFHGCLTEWEMVKLGGIVLKWTDRVLGIVYLR